MDTNVNFGGFRGRVLSQKNGQYGKYRSVFVKLQGQKNDLVYPSFGGVIANPPKGLAKMFAGDLGEFRMNEKGEKPVIYLLKTFKVISASGSNVTILRDPYLHVPFVGDILMKAPSVIGGAGKGVTITKVEAVKASYNSGTTDAFKLTFTGTLDSTVKDDILVEAVAEGESTMLIKKINCILDADLDFVEAPATYGDDDDFEKGRYLYTPAVGGTMYIHKMSPMPKCVLDLNRSEMDGWFRVDWFAMGASSKQLKALEARIAALEAKKV